MPITLDGTTGITTPTYNGTDTAEYIVPVTAFKNRFINGDMRIDQRNAGGSVTVNAFAQFYPVDRWYGFGQATDGVFTVVQNTDAPAGFHNSVLATVTTADASIGAAQTYGFVQRVEGFNVADLNFGTANAKTITISFWVKSSVTGSFGARIANSALNRSYPFSYTISSANTWEYKTVTIAGDTTGTWLKDNGIGLQLAFSFGAGTNFQGTANAWAASDFLAPTGSVNLISTLNATWRVAGVQLEVGSTATSFDYRPYGTELVLCQRYYETNYPPGSAVGSNMGVINSAVEKWGQAANDFYDPNVFLRVTKRTGSPTVTTYAMDGTANRYFYVQGAANVTSNVYRIGNNIFKVAGTGGNLLTGGLYGFYYTVSDEF